MPRRHRAGCAGVIFHVLNRGAFQHRLFSQRAEYAAFIEVLTEGLTRFEVLLLALCVMPNHFHLVLVPRTDDALSRFMAWATTTHALRWRRACETSGQGAVYQGRFKSIPVQNDVHLMVLLWYVERNARRANLVTRAEDWPWSSASGQGGNCSGLPLAPWPILRPDNWLELVNSGEPPSGIDEIRLAIRKGRPFGEEQWQRETAIRLGLEHTLRDPGRPRRVSCQAFADASAGVDSTAGLILDRNGDQRQAGGSGSVLPVPNAFA